MNPDVSEREFQGAVIDLAQLHGWRVAHFRTAMNARRQYQTPVAADGKGWPDLFLVHPDSGQTLAVECKSAKGKTTDEQDQWLDDLARCGIPAEVWRPKDWAYIVIRLDVRALTTGIAH